MKTKLTNNQILNLWTALNIVAQTDIPTRMRYAIARCRHQVEPVAAAINYASKPEVESPENLERAAAIRKSGGSKEDEVWLAEHDHALAERKRLLETEAEVELYPIPICGSISDSNFRGPTIAERCVRDQLLVEALMPALVPDGPTGK